MQSSLLLRPGLSAMESLAQALVHRGLAYLYPLRPTGRLQRRPSVSVVHVPREEAGGRKAVLPRAAGVTGAIAEPAASFKQLSLAQELHAALLALNIQEPTEIQVSNLHVGWHAWTMFLGGGKIQYYWYCPILHVTRFFLSFLGIKIQIANHARKAWWNHQGHQNISCFYMQTKAEKVELAFRSSACKNKICFDALDDPIKPFKHWL